MVSACLLLREQQMQNFAAFVLTWWITTGLCVASLNELPHSS